MPFFWFRQRRGSAQRAKDRLLAAIVYDRFWLAPEEEEAMRKEVVEVLRRYLPPEVGVRMRMEVREEGSEVYLAFRIPKGEGVAVGRG